MADGSRSARVRASNPAQHAFKFRGELIVDLFAGGGGASIGIEQAFGRPVDIAINHNRLAVDVHTALHPHTTHYCEDVYAVDPVQATRGQPVGLLHASPDCTHHSQAKGGQPRKAAVRALSWVVLKWAGRCRPRVITLENVHQIVQWCPLVAARCKTTGRVKRLDGSIAAPGERTPRDQQFLVPDHSRKGHNWQHLVQQLRGMGYAVEWRRIKACDYGAGTKRDRLFLIARCDGLPIRWPAPTHAPSTHADVRKHKRSAHITAGDCLDWTLPACSIFATQIEANAWAQQHGGFRPKRPLRPATLRRIARGVTQYVLNAAEPFIVPVTHQGGDRAHARTDPLPTITAANRGELAAIVPTLVQITHTRSSDTAQDAREPLGTITTSKGGEYALATAVMLQAGHGEGLPNGAQRWGKGCTAASEPIGTVTASGGHALVTAFLEQAQGGFAADNAGHAATEPLSTIASRGTQQRLITATLTTAPTLEAQALRVAAFLVNYYGQGKPRDLTQPLDTITTKDRLALVTVQIRGVPWVIVDICMRMLSPHELARCQGFPPEYPLTHRADGRPVSKTDQVRLIGNSVSPPPLRAIVAANVGELLAVERRTAA